MSATPSLSVVMPVRNAARYLDASISSVVTQTFEDFELVIVDDASTDGSSALLQRWARHDARIRLHRSDSRLGVVRSSNFVVARASAPLVARMDADDISHRDRLRRQWRVMHSRPEVGLVGTLCDGIDANGHRVRPRDRWRLVRRSFSPPFPHGSVMFRRSIFDDLGGYREACAGWEDQDLFLRFLEKSEIVTLPEALYHYRFHDSSVSAASTSGAPSADAIRSAAAMQLWAGNRPAIFRSLLRRHATPGALLWAAWASLNPRGLRLLCRGVIRMRDLVAGCLLRGEDARPWRYE